MTDWRGERPPPIDDQHYVAWKAGYPSGGTWEQRWIGDGLAVVAPRFMDFGGPRVPIVPDGQPSMALPMAFLSALHRHNGCLGEVIHSSAVAADVRECSVTHQLYLAQSARDGQ